MTRDRRRAFLRTALGFITQFFVPLALSQALIRPPQGGVVLAVAMAALLAGYVSYIVPVGQWTPRATLLVPLACLLAVPIGLARPGGAEPQGGGLIVAAITGGLALFFWARAWQALRGRTALPGAAIEIDAPLGPGRYLVAQGGSKALLNAHLACLAAPRLRGQSFGIDIVGLSGAGLTAPPFRRGDAESYEIFGRDVLAPANAVVTHVKDGMPDLSPPQSDPEHPMGNHVWLEADGPCGRVAILLAHLRENTICVAATETVRQGQKIAEVGNSGNTSEPHLHIHVQTPGDIADPLAAEPVPMQISGLGPLYRGRRFRLD